ncbi:MAG: hypothetical protein MRZ79_20130 [Bacteroidia bacterium]|nr:hypothetical protein [Bacteroidia bacterium]
MGRWVHGIRGFSMAIVIIGLLFKILHWQWAFEILVVGLSLWVLYIGLNMIDLLQKRKRMSNTSFVRQICGHLGVSCLLLSFFLPYIGLPFSNVLFIMGIGFGIVYGVMMFFFKADEERSSEEEDMINQIGSKS